MPIRFLDEEEEDVTPIPSRQFQQSAAPVGGIGTPATKRKIRFLDEEPPQQGGLPSFEEMFKPKPKEVGVFEGIANAAQNAFASSQQAIKTVGGVTSEEAKEISKLEFEKKAREVSPDYKAYQDAEGMDAVKAFITNPFEVTTNIVAEGLSGSLPALGTGLAAGAVGAAIGAPTVIGAPAGFLGGQIAGTFAGSLATEYGGKMLEELQNAGMDINNPDSITEFFSNQKLVDEARDKALKRGVPVAAFDALSAGIGGKVAKITKAAFKTPVREVAAETAIQAALGGGGEVAGSLTAGEEIRPKDVFAEIVGEVGPGAAEIAIGKVQQGFAERRKQRQLQEAAKVASNLENNNAPLTAQAVTVTSAKDALQQEKQTNEQTETELAQEREKFAPKTTVYEVPAKEEFKTTFAKMSPESIAQTEQGFREELESEDADTRAFAQAGLDALAEFRAETTPPVEKKLPTDVLPTETPGATYGRESELYDVFAGVRRRPLEVTQPTAPTPITVPPVEEVAPAVAAVTQPAAPAAPVTPAAPAAPKAPAEPITSADAQVINNLRSVADNTANREQISTLSAAGLVDIIKGQPVINEDGEALLAQAQAPLPRLTPEERVAEIQAAPPAPPVEAPAAPSAPAAEAPAIVEQAPVVSEEDAQVSEINQDINLFHGTSKTSADAILQMGWSEAESSFFMADNPVKGMWLSEDRQQFQPGGNLEAEEVIQFTIPAGSKVIEADYETVLSEYDRLGGDENAARQVTEKYRNLGADVIRLKSPGMVDELVVLNPQIAKPSTITATAPAPTISEKPPTSEIVSPATAQPAPAQAVAPVAPATAPTIGEKPPTSPMIGAEPTQPAPAEGVAPPNINDPKYKNPDGSIDLDRYDTDEAAWYSRQGGEYTITEESRKLNEERNAIRKEIDTLEKQYARESRKKSMLPPAIKAERLGRISNKITDAESRLSSVDERIAAEPTRAVTPAPEPAAAPAVVPEREGAPAPIESFKTNIKNSGFKYITYSDFRKANKTEDWENEGGVTIDESYYPTAVVGDTSVAFTTNGLSLYKGRVEVSYEADVDANGNNIFTIERIVTSEGKRGTGSASKALSEVTSAADKAGLTLQLEPAAVKPLIKKGGKGLTNKQLVDWYKRNGFVQKFEGSDLILIRPPAAPAPAVTTPPAPEAVTPAPEGIAVGNRVKLGRSPQTYEVVEILPQSEAEMANDEQSYRIRNENTGEVITSERKGMSLVGGKAKADKRYNPLGYDIAEVVEDIKAGKTDTPFRAVNQVIKEAQELRGRIMLEAMRRKQPRKVGKAAILERIARERSAGTISEATARALIDFVNSVREDAIGDTSISIRQKGVSNFDFADNLVTFFLNQDKGDLGAAVGIHEFWHGLSRFLPESEVQKINKEYVKELEAYLKKNPWFLAFVGRYSLSVEQFNEYKKFNPVEAETKLEPVRDAQGNIIKYKIKFDKSNYRYIMLDEFIAEKMTDLVIGKQTVPNTFFGKLAKVFREFLALIKARLGLEPYEKFYQLVTSTSDKLILQRTSGVAAPIQIYDPVEYDYSTRRMMAVEAEPTVEPAAEAPQRKPRPTTIQRLIEATTGVKRKRDLLTINEKTALKDQLKLGAKKRRLDAAQQKEFVKDLTAQLREEAIRGRVKAPQLRAIVNKAMQVRFDNDASILSFLNYANKVIDNANYDKDLSDARKAVSRAKQLSKQKGVPADAQKILEKFSGIDPRQVDDPAEFAAVLNEFMAGYGDVLARDYIVIPNAEMDEYFKIVDAQAKEAQVDKEFQAMSNALNSELGKEGITDEEVAAILAMPEEDFVSMIEREKQEARTEKQKKRAEAKEKAINALSGNVQSALREYTNPNLTTDTKAILKDMQDIDLSQLNIGAKKEFVRAANGILVNNTFFGAEKFSARAKGQMGAARAAKDAKQKPRTKAMLDFLRIGQFRIVAKATARKINLQLQSISDTFRNIAGKSGAAKLQEQMGMGDLLRGMAAADREKAEFSEALLKKLQEIEEKTGQKVSDPQGSKSMGVAATLIQTFPDETEAEGIARIRKMIEEQIIIMENSYDDKVVEDAKLVRRALEDVSADSVAGILDNLKKAYPANYEMLMFVKDVALPSFKPLFKEHDELFNNQTDNYDNPNYIPLRFRQEGVTLEAKEQLQGYWNRGTINPKQAPNSIKRKKYTTLPKDRMFDFNMLKNVLGSVNDQLDATYTNTAWEQVKAFLESPEGEIALGGKDNLDFVTERLNILASSRTRIYTQANLGNDIADSIANVGRATGYGYALGGIGQIPKQYFSQMITGFVNVKDKSLMMKSAKDVMQGNAKDIMSLFSIGMRGDIIGGTKWSNQAEGNYGKLEKFYEAGKFPQAKDALTKLNNLWLYPLKISDTHAAQTSWLAYYRQYLQDNNLEFKGWETEAQLVRDGDNSRNEAGNYAEMMTDLYQGSSDPTRMAAFAQRGKGGYENLVKSIFLPFLSFVLQERMRMFSDYRDAVYGAGKEKTEGAKALAGAVASQVVFHTVRRFILPVMMGYGASLIYAMLGVDMDEPDEDKQKEEAERKWRQFKGEVLSNIFVGGFGAITEKSFLTAINGSFYFIEKQLGSENVLDDEGEVMDYKKYVEKRSPFWQYQGFGSEADYGMLSITPGQFGDVMDRLEKMSNEEFMDSLTEEERKLILVAGVSEILYTLRMNDADLNRMFRRMSKDVEEQAKEREKADKRLQQRYSSGR